MGNFKIGDDVIYVYNGIINDIHRGLRREIYLTKGKVIKFLSDGRIGVEFEKPFDFMHSCSNIGKAYQCYNVDPVCLDFVDKKVLKRREELREISRINHEEIDPYGEEDWEDFIMEDIDYYFQIGDNVKVRDNYNLEDFKNKNGKIIKLEGDLIQVRFENEKTKLFYENDISLTNKSEIMKRKRLKIKTEKEIEEDRKKKEKLVKESVKPKFLDLNEFIDKCGYNITVIENDLQELLIGEEVIFYTMADIMKKTVVSSVQVDEKKGNYYIFFNNFSVNKNYTIELEQRETENPYIVGLPTGEVIYVTIEQMKKLKSEFLVKYTKEVYFRNNRYININYFADTDYHKIMLSLDKNYKKKTNIEKHNNYTVGDYIVCQGISQNLNVDGQIAQVEGSVITKNGRMYLVSFLFRFSEMLHNGDGGTGNKWWVFSGNIKGKYTGDINLHLDLSNMMRNELEDYEIDDDYHIKNLFK
jgi:hypothetical protein